MQSDNAQQIAEGLGTVVATVDNYNVVELGGNGYCGLYALSFGIFGTSAYMNFLLYVAMLCQASKLACFLQGSRHDQDHVEVTYQSLQHLTKRKSPHWFSFDLVNFGCLWTTDVVVRISGQKNWSHPEPKPGCR